MKQYIYKYRGGPMAVMSEPSDQYIKIGMYSISTRRLLVMISQFQYYISHRELTDRTRHAIDSVNCHEQHQKIKVPYNHFSSTRSNFLLLSRA